MNANTPSPPKEPHVVKRGERYQLVHVAEMYGQNKGFTDGRGLDYVVAPDGSLRALNKPRSRVKRLREERAAKLL